MPTFTAPVVFDQPRVVPGPHRGNAIMRHYGAAPRGVNVYITTAGVATETFPGDWTLVRRTFYGGHVAEHVTEAEAAILAAAGYTTNSSGPYALGYVEGY